MQSCARLLISYPLILSGKGCLRESVSVGRGCTGILTEFCQGVRKSFLLTTVSISGQSNRFIVKFRARKDWAQVLVQEFSFHPRQAGLQLFAMHCPSSVNQVTRFISLVKNIHAFFVFISTTKLWLTSDWSSFTRYFSNTALFCWPKWIRSLENKGSQSGRRNFHGRKLNKNFRPQKSRSSCQLAAPALRRHMNWVPLIMTLTFLSESGHFPI